MGVRVTGEPRREWMPWIVSEYDGERGARDKKQIRDLVLQF